ncbi:MAG: disulfide bond formation protein B [Rhodobacteraceae bacterium]|nr:disulfide bond formation protein B [Paracoccaceae bacterium]
MTRKLLVGCALLGSAALLAGAFAFQHLGGLAPCKMCIWQRYPHVAAVALGLAALGLGYRGLAWLGAAAAAVAAALGLYHTGVERGWWEGPSTCSSGSISGLSADDLLEQIMAAPLVRCDEVAWSLLGLSMASWNAVLSLILMALWIAAARRGG